MNISPNLSAPIKLMKPYFLLSSSFYLLSMIWLFFINPHANILESYIIGWAHLYMLGFVMMSIFSAMAQLGSIVAETKHFHVNIFKYVWIFLTIGLTLMLLGFYNNVAYLLYGGVFISTAMSIYAIEFLLTLKKASRKTAITKAMKMSNLFLLLGIISGLIMACGFNGCININPHTIIKAHIFGLVVGFVILLIMGISIILIPMFGMAKRISDNEFSKSFITLSIAVSIMLISPIFFTSILEKLSYFLTIAAFIIYLYQLYKMLHSRTKVIHDIWARSMYVGFISFIISFVLLTFYLFNDDETILKLGMWILFIGFFGFLIIGNFYKIIPFLVWFQIYSPLLEERDVPMLHDLLPNRLANLQWLFSTLGIITSSFGIIYTHTQIFYAGVTFLAVGGSIFLIIVNKLLNTKL